MKINFEGRTWDLDTAHVSFRHALAVQRQTGMSVADWEDSLDFRKDDAGKIANPPPEWLVSVGALYWLMCAQNGEAPDPDAMDFDWMAFLQAYFAALVAELGARAPEPEPGPTSPSGEAPSPAPATRTDTTRKSSGPAEGAATVS